MLDTEIAGSLVQFGTAGLMGWMWLTERRGAAARERQLDEAHARITEQRVGIEALLGAVRENTKVLGQIEAGQRIMMEVFGRPVRAARGTTDDQRSENVRERAA